MNIGSIQLIEMLHNYPRLQIIALGRSSMPYGKSSASSPNVIQGDDHTLNVLAIQHSNICGSHNKM